MKVIICESHEEAADLVAAEVLRGLENKSDLVLGLATGSTPVGVYTKLVRTHKEHDVDFSRVRTFNLDEYVGLPRDHSQSYHSFMWKHLFSGLNLEKKNVHFPPTDGPELNRKCRQYEETIRNAGGIDIQILGIGSNGHIGFNEPTSSLASRTRIKTLTEKTLKDNARFYMAGEEQPQLASTMGIGTILDAKRIVLQAFGFKKAEAIRATVEGPISSFWPGSALQQHPAVALYLDVDSASRLTMQDYYRRVGERTRELDNKRLL